MRELLLMITKKTYQNRRDELADYIGDGVVLVSAGKLKNRNSSVNYLFKADTNFFYMTGFEEPESVAVFYNDGESPKFILFCQPRDSQKELWNGRIIGQEEAVLTYGADLSYPIENIDREMVELLKNRDKIFLEIGNDPSLDQSVLGWLNELKRIGRRDAETSKQLVDLSSYFADKRVIKSEPEIAAMRAAAALSAEGHKTAMRVCEPSVHEYQVQAKMESVFREGGSERNAYNSVVAGGKNACVLHYITNREKLNDGELLLIDAGAELDGYTADITRTFPINGVFSPEQRALYEIVLAAQSAALEKCVVGESWIAPHDAAVRVISQGLLSEGLLQGSLDEVLEQQLYRRFFMHSTSHWLGLDVHDPGAVKSEGEWRAFEPGMVFTVEPGLYVVPADDVDPRFHNIGIRIEDNVLITEGAPDILTAGVPKTVEEIEKWMRD
jgi:Xaa-Pro aminopeptidase